MAAPEAQRYAIAHFVLGNAAAMTADDWRNDIVKATSMGIDAFALNIALLDPNNNSSLSKAFAAAEELGCRLKLYLNFDYQAWGTWDAKSVITNIYRYQRSPAYFRYCGRPFVSTFEGAGNAGDWLSIKHETNCFFVPDWSSIGPHEAAKHLGIAVDGLASWNAWPEGPNNLTTSEDKVYIDLLHGRPYMMPISPWFYTNLPQYGKNWMWRSEDLWHYRWEQAIKLSGKAHFVQIISWNDYGESHHIGPIHPAGQPAGSEWYVADHDHQAWGDLLPHYIRAYKSGSLSELRLTSQPPEEEKLVYWYRVNPGLSGSAAGTTGNNPNYQKAYSPHVLAEDRIFMTVLLRSPAKIMITIGDSNTQVLKAAAGLSCLSTSFKDRTGAVHFEVYREAKPFLKATGPPITKACVSGNVNWNPVVGRAGKC